MRKVTPTPMKTVADRRPSLSPIPAFRISRTRMLTSECAEIPKAETSGSDGLVAGPRRGTRDGPARLPLVPPLPGDHVEDDRGEEDGAFDDVL